MWMIMAAAIESMQQWLVVVAMAAVETAALECTYYFQGGWAKPEIVLAASPLWAQICTQLFNELCASLITFLIFVC